MNPLKLKTISLLSCKREPYRSLVYKLPSGYFEELPQDVLDIIINKDINTHKRKTINSNYELCKLLIMKNVISINFIYKELRTYELYLRAIINNAGSIIYLPEHLLNEEYYDTLINLNPCVLFHIYSISYENSITAIKRNSFTLSYEKKIIQTKEIQRLAVQKNGLSLYYFPTTYYKDEIYSLCKLAVSNFGIALKFVPQRYIDGGLCNTAIENCKLACYYIPHELRIKYNYHIDDEYPLNWSLVKDNLYLHRNTNIRYSNIKGVINEIIRQILDCYVNDLNHYKFKCTDENIRRSFYKLLYMEFAGLNKYVTDKLHLHDISFKLPMSIYYPFIDEEYY